MSGFRRYLPKNTTDAIATVFTFCGINAIAYFEFLYMLPRISAEPDYPAVMWYFHMFCGWYIYVNALSAFWKTIVVDSTIRGHLLPTFTKEGELMHRPLIMTKVLKNHVWDLDPLCNTLPTLP